jgi:hypothetical protein
MKIVTIIIRKDAFLRSSASGKANALMTKTISVFETSVSTYQTTRCNIQEDSHLPETSFVSNIPQPKDNVEDNIGTNAWWKQPHRLHPSICCIRYSTAQYVPCSGLCSAGWYLGTCIRSSASALTKRRELNTAAHRVVTYPTAVCSTGILWHACCREARGTNGRITMQLAICK